MKPKGYTLEQITRRIPRDFWADIKRMTGDSRQTGSLSTFWKDHQEEISAEISRILNADTVGSIDNLVVDSSDTVDNTASMAPEAENEPVEPTVDSDDTVDNACNAIVNNDIIEPEPESMDTYKRGTESRILAIEQEIKALNDKLDSVIIGRGDQASPSSTERVSPPKPPRSGHKYAGHYPHVRAVTDAVLVERLTDMAARDHGGNVSAALTEVLWTFFDRPALSFQIPEDELTKLKRRFPVKDRTKKDFDGEN